MGKRSTRENKNIYQLCREKSELTREKASEKMIYISDDRIEKIESAKSLPHPDEILAMAECYREPSLCNYFCSHECPIGQKYVPEIKERSLSQIILEMLASLNTLDKEKNRLIEITADGAISVDEYADFVKIQKQLSRLSLSVEALRIWVEKTASEGEIDRELLEQA